VIDIPLTTPCPLGISAGSGGLWNPSKDDPVFFVIQVFMGFQSDIFCSDFYTIYILLIKSEIFLMFFNKNNIKNTSKISINNLLCDSTLAEMPAD
jgi:hypothetical protein